MELIHFLSQDGTRPCAASQAWVIVITRVLALIVEICLRGCIPVLSTALESTMDRI